MRGTSSRCTTICGISTAPSPVVLFDQIYNGVKRKGVAEACKTGWIYILDRTNGKPLIGIDEKPVEVRSRVVLGRRRSRFRSATR